MWAADGNHISLCVCWLWINLCEQCRDCTWHFHFGKCHVGESYASFWNDLRNFYPSQPHYGLQSDGPDNASCITLGLLTWTQLTLLYSIYDTITFIHAPPFESHRGEERCPNVYRRCSLSSGNKQSTFHCPIIPPSFSLLSVFLLTSSLHFHCSSLLWVKDYTDVQPLSLYNTLHHCLADHCTPPDSHHLWSL